MRRSWIAAFGAAVVVDLAFLAPAIFTSAVRAPADVTPQWPPFVADLPQRPAPPKNEILNDWLLAFHPWHHLVREAYEARRIPLWNDKSGCGEPLLGNLQCEALSPFVPLLLLTGDQYVDWRQLAQLIVAEAFCLLLCASLGLSPLAALVAALAYAFSSYMQVWAIHPLAASACFAPGILWALLRLDARPSWARLLFASTLVGLSILAGHLETAAKSGLLAGAVTILVALLRRPRDAVRAALLAAAAGACGILLAGCALAPFADYASQSDVHEVRAIYADQNMLPLRQMLTLLDPCWFGSPLNPRTYHGERSWPDTVIHVGVVPLVLAAAGLLVGAWRRPRLVVPLAAVAAAGVAVACGSPAFARFWAAIPALGAIWPWRFLYVAILPLALLSGLGFDVLAGAAGGWSRRARRIGAAVVVAGAAVSAAAPWHGFIPAAPVSELHPGSRALTALATRGTEARCIELGPILPQGFGELYGLRRVIRYDAMGLRRLSEALRYQDETFPLFPDGTALTFAPPALLDALSVRWVLSLYPAADARFPTKPERVEPGPGTTIELARVPKFDGPLDLVLFRPMGRSAKDGTIEVLIGRQGAERTWFLGPGGWSASVGEPPPRPARPEIEAFLAAQLKRFQPVAFSVPRDLLDPGASLTFRLRGAAEPFWVAALLPGGVGAVREVENQGWLRISERPGAFPLAYLARGVTRAEGMGAASKILHDGAFDPHTSTIVEAPAGETLPADAPPADGERVSVTGREPGAIAVEVEASVPRMLVLTDAFARGWEARVDGARAPLWPANVVGMACPVPAGRHTVKLRYAPASFPTGCAISIATLLVLAGAAIRARRGARGADLSASGRSLTRPRA